jgi:hypothetical protein
MIVSLIQANCPNIASSSCSIEVHAIQGSFERNPYIAKYNYTTTTIVEAAAAAAAASAAAVAVTSNSFFLSQNREPMHL